ncbi:GDP-mannose-dependent alpha-mannosyltransferase [Kordiimonas sediminis]|uniref:GDP-mannose-dependent alpha-mannosyltransferase n=2 Tax=Kordiimonas sediminis TaxID=1735581 RepID=A0A919AL83_9PROT|nr:GDP-mannose-dependent alpha-mannosyltransferase [Kordiimonas sediminis]
MKICIISDAWHPQVNGVVRTLDTLRKKLRKDGHKVLVISPAMFRTVPCPTYPEIRLAIDCIWKMPALLKKWQPDAIHIATEGPLGWSARRYCRKSRLPFTTAYHTAFPEYIEARTHLPAKFFYPVFRRFHNQGAGVLVATQTVRSLLASKGFINIIPWTRGVDTDQFRPTEQAPAVLDDTAETSPRSSALLPRLLYVGRVAVEKNIEAFLDAPVEGKKVVVGDGPALHALAKKYSDVEFLGPLYGHDLSRAYSAADVFVFPSKTDTFGLVMIEALACGTPVAAYPVQGPLDVVGFDGTGPFPEWDKPVAVLDHNLGAAIKTALAIPRPHCTEFAALYSWDNVKDQFVDALHPIAEPQESSKKGRRSDPFQISPIE